MITDPEELTKAMTEAGELEDSIEDKIAMVLRFIELQTRGKGPQPSLVSHASLISRATIVSTELPLLLSSTVQPTSTLALESNSDITLHSSTSVSINAISSIVSFITTVGTVATVPLISTPLLSSMMPATAMNPYSDTLAPRTVLTSLASSTSIPESMATIQKLRSHVHVSSQSLNSRLLFPVFSGDPLNWQTFWDSFNTAIHINPTFGCIQKKLNCLKAQLQDVARAMAGLPLIINIPLNF